MPKTNYTQDNYEQDFFDESIRKEALSHALDIRKFEIELYWKRAAYFWTFIGATFAGFIAVKASTSANEQDLSVMLSCLGLVFSFGWFCVNRGSKHWQENWEKHVDMLEDKVTGPLYKVVLTRRPPSNWKERGIHLITGPSPLSVSKINQIISIYVTVLWLFLLIYSLPKFSLSADINWLYFLLVALSIVTCALFLWLGRTYVGGFWHKATIRTTTIRND